MRLPLASLLQQSALGAWKRSWMGWKGPNLSTAAVRDSMSFDVVIVGAGPAGLSAAIKLKQVCGPMLPLT